MSARLAVLNGMASSDFTESVARQKAWGISDLDIKGGVFGKSVEDLTETEALRAKEIAEAAGMSVHCISTGLFHSGIELGEEEFRRRNLDRLGRVLETAVILRTRFIRLLPATLEKRAEVSDSIKYIRKTAPWLFDHYRSAIEAIGKAGFEATVENETYGCLFTGPEEVLGFFDEVGGAWPVSFTWDVQNMWQSGTFPSIDVYRRLRPLIGYLHLKGGIADDDGRLKWSSALEDASWPVVEITGRAVADGVSEVICLNPSHGEKMPGYRYDCVVEKDLEFLRHSVEGVE